MVNARRPRAPSRPSICPFRHVHVQRGGDLRLPVGTAGLRNLRSFIALQLETQDQIIWLQSLDNLSIALPLGDPWTFFPDYDPKIPDYARLSLDLTSARFHDPRRDGRHRRGRRS